MKKIAFLVLFGLVLISCKEEKPVKDFLILSGQVENFKKRSITLTGFNFDQKIRFDKKAGAFIDTVRIERDGYYTLVMDKKPLKVYLTKTDDTGIIFDYKNSSIINFEGKNATINNYFLEKSKKYNDVFGSVSKLFSSEESDFLDKVDEYKSALTELAISSNLPADFLKSEVRNIDYECSRITSLYQKNHSILSDNEDFVVSEDFPNIVESISFNNGEDYMNSFHYLKLLNEILEQKTQENLKEDDDYYLTYLETVQTEVTDPIIKNDLIYKSANDKSGITYTENLKPYYDKFMAYSTNEKHKKQITDSYETLKTIAKGKPAPKFNDYVNYNGGNTSLDDLLGNGKYLYIDVWATWCGFCKREIPLLKMLEEEYHGKDIEFVSINVDTKDKLEKWKETIEIREMTGVQLFSGQSHLQLPWAKNFIIKGLPRFILVDPDGNIVSPNAPAPSQGEKLINMFDKLGI